MASFSFKDGVLTLTPGQVVSVGALSQVVPAGPPFRIFSATKVSGDPGGKTTPMKGFDVRPLTTLIQTADGKLDIECSNAAEVWSARQAMGGIYSTIIVSLVFARLGMPPQDFLFSPSTWENGGLFDGSDGNGWTDKIAIKFIECLHNQTSIYNANA